MTLAATSAFAPDFAHTSAAPDVSLAFAAGVSPVTASLATGTYRMWLTSSSTCYLRALALAVKLAIVAARGSSPTVTATLSAAGVVSFTFLVDVPTTVTFVAPMWRRLGMAAAASSVSAGAIVGTLPVMGLALLTASKHGPWQPHQAGGVEQTTGGRVYAIAASATSWSRTHAVTFQPTTPEQRATQAADATALIPSTAYLTAVGSTDTAREWSVVDVLYAARNARCGFALDNWRTLRTSTSERFHEGYVGPRALLAPKLSAADEVWDAWAEWELDVVLPVTAASSSRA